MDINVEAYGLKIGVDNSVTEALRDGKWGILVEFTSETHDMKYKVVVPVEVAKQIIIQIQASIDSIAKTQKGNYVR